MFSSTKTSVFNVYQGSGYLGARQYGRQPAFEETAQVSTEWITDRTGIIERRRCGPGENTNTMAWRATELLLHKLPVNFRFDLIIGATYTPFDTIVTLAHYVQHHLGVPYIPVLSVSTASSSIFNAFEIA